MHAHHDKQRTLIFRHPSRLLTLWVLLPTCLATLTMATGCKITGEDIEYWKGTEKGPGKIVAVMLADKYPVSLRSEAALALVAMERQDVEELDELENRLEELDEQTRAEMIEQIVPGVIALMQDPPEAAQATKDGEKEREGPTPQQSRAKDAAFVLIKMLDPKAPARKTLGNAVVDWYVEDFNGRSLAGHYRVDEVLKTLGAPAAARLTDAANAKMPPTAMVKLAELVSKLGDPATKARAGQRLVQIEKEAESPEVLAWLSDKFRKAWKEQYPDKPVDEKRVAFAAQTKQNEIVAQGVLPAMKYLSDQKEVANRLLEIASTSSSTTLSREQLTLRRQLALRALEGNATQEHLPRLLELALDGKNPPEVRDYAFDRIGDIGSPEAVPPMWPVVAGNDPRLRWRAGELVLALGGNAVLNEFFAKLPVDPPKGYAREELEGYGTRIGTINPSPTRTMRAQLRSGRWWDRVVALYYFERKGKKAELGRMRALRKDSASTKGPHWPKGFTVGKVASEAVTNLEQRLEGAKPKGQGS